MDVLFRQDIGNLVTFGGMFNVDIQVEFLANPHCRENIIRAVGMNVHTHFPPQDRYQGFHLQVALGGCGNL